MVPLDYDLKRGEIVDIETSSTAQRTRDWLNFARTTAAGSKFRRYLKIDERDINILIGRERLDRELKVQGLRGIETINEEAQNWLIEEYRKGSFEDILAAIGGDDIRQHAVVVKLVDFWQLREQRDGKEEVDGPLALPGVTTQTTSARLQVAGGSGLLTTLADCCCPLSCG